MFAALRRFFSYSRAKLRFLKLDRQSGLNTSQVRQWCFDRQIQLRFVTPLRHGELNAVVERVIYTLRVMSRAALLSARMTSRYWRFAVKYAAFVKNLMPHASLAGQSPYWIHYNRMPNYSLVKVFGALCYQLTPLRERRDKFSPTTAPRVFLGYADHSSFSTVLLLNPLTKRASFRHLQDVYFNENLSYQEHRKEERTRLAVDVKNELEILKHQRFLCEDSDTDEEISFPQHNSTSKLKSAHTPSGGTDETATSTMQTSTGATATSTSTGNNPKSTDTVTDTRSHYSQPPELLTEDKPWYALPRKTSRGHIVRLPSYLRDEVYHSFPSIYAVMSTS